MAIAILLLVALVALAASPAAAKTTIEPCSGADTCPALLGYTLYTDLKVSEVAALFGVDPLSLLAVNSLSFASAGGGADPILPAGLFLRVPTRCVCSDGVRKSVSVRYAARPADTLNSIAASVFSGLASADQIRQANGLLSTDPNAPLNVGQQLVIYLPCVCFNSTDNFVPAIYLSYVVRPGDSVPGIAAQYATTASDLMNVNSMAGPTVVPGDIIAIPLPACPSTFMSSASDYGLLVANGTYTLTAGRCVECSCGPGNLNLFCMPSSLPVSCSSMQCPNSNLMLGNLTAQPTSAGCNITSCNYGGFVNGSIVATLTTSLQPQCPGQRQFPALMPPSSIVLDENNAPAPAPVAAQAGGVLPRPSAPGTSGKPAVSPGPVGSVSKAPSRCLDTRVVIVLGLVFNLLM